MKCYWFLIFAFSLSLYAHPQNNNSDGEQYISKQFNDTNERDLSLYNLALDFKSKRQGRTSDSILNLLGVQNIIERNTLFSAKVMLTKATLKYYFYDTDSSIFYYRKALEKFRMLGENQEVLMLYRKLPEPFLRVRMVDSAFYYINLAIEIDSINSHIDNYVKDLIIKSGIYTSIGQTQSALDILDKALKITIEFDNDVGTKRVYTRIGRVYLNVGEYSNAEKYFYKAEEIENELGSPKVHLKWLKTILYYKWGKYEIADSINLEARLLCDSIKTPALYSILLLQTARNSLAKEEYDRAEYFSNRSNEIVQINQPLNGLAKNYLFKSRLLTGLKKYKEANFWIDSALYYGELIYDPLVRIKMYHQKSLIAYLIGDNEVYNLFQNKYNGVKDSVSGVKNLRAVLDYDFGITTENMKDEVNSLSTQLEEEKSSRSWNQKVGFSIFIISFISLIMLFIRIRSRNKIKKIELDRKNQELNKELTTNKQALDQIKETGILSLKDLPNHFEPLSKREKEVFELLVLGQSDKDISDNLFISLATVRTHIRHIYEKFHIKSRMEAKDISLKFRV